MLVLEFSGIYSLIFPDKVALDRVSLDIHQPSSISPSVSLLHLQLQCSLLLFHTAPSVSLYSFCFTVLLLFHCTSSVSLYSFCFIVLLLFHCTPSDSLYSGSPSVSPNNGTFTFCFLTPSVSTLLLGEVSLGEAY